MLVTPNPELDRTILNHLADLYKIKEKREPNHLSTYIYCLTKAYWEQRQGIAPTDEEVLLFSLGYGLQDVLTPKDAIVPYYEKDGIVYRPDLEFPRLGHPGEIKTTRTSPNTHAKNGFSPSWLQYMMGVCFLQDVREYELIILYMVGVWRPPTPILTCYRLEFDDDEVFDNWMWLSERKTTLDVSLALDEPPMPYKHCNDDTNWECKYCRYKLQCEAWVMTHPLESEEFDD